MSEPLHLPEREGWRCTDDREDWPCEEFKRRLRARHGCDVVAMSEAMVPWMRDARHKLVLSALQLHERFFGWIPRCVGEKADD